MAQPDHTIPQTKTPKSPVRMPQRSEEVSGDEKQGESPIAAVEETKKKATTGAVTPPARPRRPPAA
jgi:hypothetical protein